MSILTVQELVAALKRTPRYSNMNDEELDELATRIMSLFGFNTEVIDNILTPHDRDIFYTLEEEGLVSSSQENSTIPGGKAWRIHYWKIKKNKIKNMAVETEEGAEKEDVYGSIPEEAWSRNPEP